MKRNLSKNISDVCDWFVENNLSIHFGEDKTKYFLLNTKDRLNKVSNLDTRYDEIQLKQYHTVSFLGCLLDETLSGESMASTAANKINSRLRLLQRKKQVLVSFCSQTAL